VAGPALYIGPGPGTASALHTVRKPFLPLRRTPSPFSAPILPASSSLHAWRGSGAIKESSPFPLFSMRLLPLLLAMQVPAPPSCAARSPVPVGLAAAFCMAAHPPKRAAIRRGTRWVGHLQAQISATERDGAVGRKRRRLPRDGPDIGATRLCGPAPVCAVARRDAAATGLSRTPPSPPPLQVRPGSLHQPAGHQYRGTRHTNGSAPAPSSRPRRAHGKPGHPPPRARTGRCE
jgi:hypothetical protein